MNYINLIRRMDKLQKADDRLRRMDPDGESSMIDDLRCKICTKLSILCNAIDEYLREPTWTWTSGGLIDAKKRQIETAMRLLGVSRRTMGWR